MEMVLNSGFCEMTQDEMEIVYAGGGLGALLGGLIGVTVGVLLQVDLKPYIYILSGGK